MTRDGGDEMSDKLANVTLRTIGVVSNEVKQPPGARYHWQDVVSEIIIDRSLTDALDGLDNYSHIIVLWWMDRVDTSEELPTKIHPRRKMELPLVGLFATRSPRRPNPIGKATVKLLERHDNILKVQGLDAVNDTPVIDIKPYIPGRDSADDVKIPPWTNGRRVRR